MAVTLHQIPCAEKISVTKALHAALGARLKKGPPEPELDDFIPQLGDIVRRLDARSVDVEAERAQRIEAVVGADDDVDTYLRHIEGYLAIESLRRTGPNAVIAQALHAAAFPSGLAYIDARIVEENFHCRASLGVLRAPENAGNLETLRLPKDWLDRWEAAIDASDAAIAAVMSHMARANSAGEAARADPEADWVDLMVRLRRHVTNRAQRDDIVRVEEGRELLRPFFDALHKLRVEGDAVQSPRQYK